MQDLTQTIQNNKRMGNFGAAEIFQLITSLRIHTRHKWYVIIANVLDSESDDKLQSCQLSLIVSRLQAEASFPWY